VNLICISRDDVLTGWCWCSGGTTVTVTGDNVDAAAQPFIVITVIITRSNSTQRDHDDQVTVTSEVCCHTTFCYYWQLEKCAVVSTCRPTPVAHGH